MIQIPLKTPNHNQISKINKIPHSPKLKEIRNYTRDNNQYDKRVISYTMLGSLLGFVHFQSF